MGFASLGEEPCIVLLVTSWMEWVAANPRKLSADKMEILMGGLFHQEMAFKNNY